MGSERYEKYAKFARRLASVRNFVLRNKAWFILGGALAVGTTAALMGTSGTITDNVPNEEFTFVYGQEYSYTASAFLGEARYQYAPEGSEEWTFEVPKNIGGYKARAVSSGTFGERYGAVHHFRIDAKEASVKLTTSTLTYGEKLTFSAEGLLPGHSLGEVTYTIEDYSSLSTTYSISSVSIHDGEGNEVRGNYALTLPQDHSEITFAKRSIALSVSRLSTLYNGELQVNDNDMTIGGLGLAEGDHLELTRPEGTFIGTYSFGVPRILSSTGEDRTHLYSITLNLGDLTISKRSLSISSPSYSKVYDGLPLTEEERGSIAVSGDGAVESDHLTTSYLKEASSFLYPGEYPNEFSYSLDHEEEYNVQTRTGTITISKRPLNIRIEGDWNYEGEKFYKEGEMRALSTDDYVQFINGTSLATGDKINVVARGDYFADPNAVQYEYQILREEVDVTEHYAVTFSGEIAFHRADLTLSGKEKTVPYDGKEHELEYVLTGLQGNDKATVSFASTQTKLTKVGSIESSVFVQSITNGEEDRARFYEVSHGSVAKLTITQRPLEILEHVTFTYDGLSSPYRDLVLGEDADYEILNGSLAEGDTLRIYPKPGSLYTENPELLYSIVNVNGEDVLDCYDLTISEDSALTCEKAPLKITGDTQEIVYDGKDHNLTYKVEGKFDNDDLTIKYLGNTSGKEVGKYTSEFSLEYSYNHDLSETTTPYYQLTQTPASLTITKRPISIVIDAEFNYDGNVVSQTLTPDQYSVGVGEDVGLCEGHTIEITLDKNPYLVEEGEKETATIIIRDPSGMAVTENYELDVSVSTTPYRDTVTFTPENYVETYDGYNHNYRFQTIGAKGFDAPEMASYPTDLPCRPGDYSFTYEVKGMSNALDKTDRTCYYDIPEKEFTCNVTILPRKLTIEYVGHGNGDIIVGGSGLAATDELEWTMVEDKPGYYRYEFHIYPRHGVIGPGQTKEDLSIKWWCYDITYEGVNSFAKQNFDVNVLASNYSYDGTPLSPSVDFSGAIVGDTFTFNDKASYTNNGIDTYSWYVGEWSKTNPGVYEMGLEVQTIKDGASHDVSAAYTVNITPNTLTIEKRHITLDIHGERTYNGQLFSSKALTDSEYTVGGLGLANGHSIRIVPVEDTILTTGVDPQFTYAITDAKGKDVTDNYVMDSITSTMTFHRASLNVHGTVGEVVSYRGKTVYPTIKAEGLLGNDVLSSYVTDPANVGLDGVSKVKYDILSAVISKGNKDVSRYYDMTFDGGDLEVSVSLLALDLGTYTGLYTGVSSYDIASYIDPSRITITGLSPGHYVDTSSIVLQGGISSKGVTEFGFANVDITGLRVLDAEGNDVSSQYDVSDIQGQVTLLVPTITVYVPTTVKTYDGQAATFAPFASIATPSVDWNEGTFDAEVEMNVSSTSFVDAGYYVFDLDSSTLSAHVTWNDIAVAEDAYDLVYGSAQASVEIRKAIVVLASPNVEEEVGYEVDYGELMIISGRFYGSDGFLTLPGDNPEVYDIPFTDTNRLSYQIIGNENNYAITVIYGTVTII